MTDDHYRFSGIAWRLDDVRWVPRDVLAEVVMRDGECIEALTSGDPPQMTGNGQIDRELAARLCYRCPVQDQCLELELRWAGDNTAGVWGALNEDDRRALYPYWRARGERAESFDESDGGEMP